MTEINTHAQRSDTVFCLRLTVYFLLEIHHFALFITGTN